jgi:hypothetical protein
MNNKINYNNFFTNACITIPKSIKGDDYEIKEIKIAKNKLYCPKMAKTMTNINLKNSFKKKSIN